MSRGTVFPVAQTRPKPSRVWLLSVVSRIPKKSTGDNNFVKWKGTFGPTDGNDQTGQSGPPSKLVPNILVEPNQNGPFRLMNQPKFKEFWIEWKAPQVILTV